LLHHLYCGQAGRAKRKAFSFPYKVAKILFVSISGWEFSEKTKVILSILFCKSDLQVNFFSSSYIFHKLVMTGCK